MALVSIILFRVYIECKLNPKKIWLIIYIIIYFYLY